MTPGRSVAAACLACLLLSAGLARAAPPSGEARRTVGEQMRRVFAARLKRDVGLDDAQVRAVAPRIDAMERERARLLRERLRLLRELRRDLDTGASDADLARGLERLDGAGQEADRVAHAALAEIDASLTVPQRARLRLLLVRFREEMARRVQDVRDGSVRREARPRARSEDRPSSTPP